MEKWDWKIIEELPLPMPMLSALTKTLKRNTAMSNEIQFLLYKWTGTRAFVEIKSQWKTQPYDLRLSKMKKFTCYKWYGMSISIMHPLPTHFHLATRNKFCLNNIKSERNGLKLQVWHSRRQTKWPLLQYIPVLLSA